MAYTCSVTSDWFQGGLVGQHVFPRGSAPGWFGIMVYTCSVILCIRRVQGRFQGGLVRSTRVPGFQDRFQGGYNFGTINKCSMTSDPCRFKGGFITANMFQEFRIGRRAVWYTVNTCSVISGRFQGGFIRSSRVGSGEI